MRRCIVLAVVLMCVACGREEPEPTATFPKNPPPTRTTPVSHAPAVTASAPRGPNKSTPQKCAGDGSYEQALDCFRISSGFHFTFQDARGEMSRQTPGLERVTFKASGATWTGEAKPAGVVWSRDGRHELSPPDLTNRVWQRTTMVLDPQKKEGTAQLAGVEPIAGEPCNHYHFTNANSGETNDVWVSKTDGRIVKWTAGKSTLELR
ncbi:MAG TPA: hypothetical protein VN380_09395 [Thermoanaerobaculia bacterium]|nr:hypothetical protein [Thermoanaerobaculia bacterium]